MSAAAALTPAPAPAPAPVPVSATLRAGDLAVALAPHKPIVANPTLGHHALVHLRAVDASTLSLRTCDGRLDLTSTLAAEISGRLDTLCDAAELAEVVSRMDAAKPLRVELADRELRITQGRRSVRLPSAGGELLAPLCDPAVEPARGAWYRVQAPARLAAMLRASLRMASPDSMRPSLYGVQLAGLGAWAYVAATDGKRALVARRSILAVPETAPAAWGLYLPLGVVDAWVDILGRAAGPAELWAPFATQRGTLYRETYLAAKEVPATPSWSALSNALKRYPWQGTGGPDGAVLRAGAHSLAARTLNHEPADITAVACNGDHGARVAPETLAAALRASVVTCDRDKDLFPRIEVSIAPGTVPALAIESSSRRGSATEDRVEVVALEGTAGAPASVNPRLLLEAVETARILGDDTDVRVAWEYSGNASTWATGPAGHTFPAAPWWVTTCGVRR